MVLFSKDNYPVTYSVLERLKVKSVNAEGAATIPNLVVLFQKIFKKNKETFDSYVRSEIRDLLFSKKIISGASAFS